jgi:hypothetical protein
MFNIPFRNEVQPCLLARLLTGLMDKGLNGS